MRGIDGDLRSAIEAASLMRRITEPTLAEVVDTTDAHELFERLRELAFVETRSNGLALHAVVRDAVSTELRHRDPERHALLRQRAARAFANTSDPVGTRGRWDQTADLLYLVDNPVVRHCYFPPDAGASEVDRVIPKDRESVTDIVTKWDGSESTEWIERWWDATPESFSVVRDETGSAAAFSAVVDTALVDRAVLESDPVVAACLADMEAHELADDERVLIIRRSLSRNGGEIPGRELAGLWIDCKRLYLELRPKLKRAYIVFIDVDAMAPMLAPLGFTRVAGRFEVAGHEFGILALDFGPRSVDGWLEHLIDVELAAAAPAADEAEAPRSEIDSLSTREREVLRLVADGLSNRAIADQLVISERTAARHVANIFLKLGVNSRAHAARLAAEAGLTQVAERTRARTA
jgi:DNA-binding CsgD family transcriptional regulator